MNWKNRGFEPTDQGGLSVLIGDSMVHAWGSAEVAASVTGASARARVAETDDGRLVGFVLARRIVDVLEIDLVGVHPGQRRSGIAGSLLATLIELESDQGLAEARLELSAANGAAGALYAGLGFVVVGRRTRYYPDGEDALLLSRMIRE